MPALTERLKRARELLRSIPHVALSTVNNDGSPHCSPVFMAFDTKLHGYWSSHPDSQHSQNIARDTRVFLVVYDSREGHGGLFIEAAAEVLTAMPGAKHALATLQARKAKLYGAMGDIQMYTGPEGPQRFYCARPLRAWVNCNERDAQGVILR